MADAYIWHLRNPDGASMGLEYATGRSAPTDTMLAHSLPERVNVDVRRRDGTLVARGRNLSGDLVSPMARLTIEGSDVGRENLWPTDADLGTPVILPGGEVGILTAWWNAEDHSAWRWSVELSNHI
jgi:hypothetical protein